MLARSRKDQDAEPSLESLANELARLETIIEGWDPAQQATVQALRTTIEDIQAGAFKQLIRTVKASPGGLDALIEALEDPWVAGVLGYHGIIRDPNAQPDEAQPERVADDPEAELRARVQLALDEVRPALLGHQGDVELLSVEPPRVEIRLLGACDGCVFSTATVKMGIERAVIAAAPEIEEVVVREQSAGSHRPSSSSPFERPWEEACASAELVEGEILAADLAKVSVLLARVDGQLRAYPNACPHLGMPLDDGHLHDGVLTCRYHGFEFLIASGECLTAPEIQLPRYPVREDEGKILVQVTT